MDDGAPFTSWTEPKWTVLLGFKIPVQRLYYVHRATVTIDRKERQMVQEGKKNPFFVAKTHWWSARRKQRGNPARQQATWQ